MRVKLLYASPLWLCANAIRMSHDNHHLSDSYMINPENTTCPNYGDSNTIYPTVTKTRRKAPSFSSGGIRRQKS